jgi:ketosteroid isomerase-like protein
MARQSTPQTVVGKFIACINARDARGLVALCTPAHVFVDSLGSRLSDRASLERGWAGYFSLFPDYRIEVEGMMSDGDLVLLHGWAAATYSKTGRAWRIPAAWRALVAGELIAEWQVYADNKPVYEILGA